MIDESAIRAALESRLGSAFAGLPVSRVGEGEDPTGPFIRTYLTREKRFELYFGIRRARGIFGILVHVPFSDGIDAAEAIARQIPPLYRADESRNGTIFTATGYPVTIREISLMTAYRGVDGVTASESAGTLHSWQIAPVQIDWRVDITATF